MWDSHIIIHLFQGAFWVDYINQNEIDVQYRQSESDGQIHQTSFTMDPMEFFFLKYKVTWQTYLYMHYVINANIITM